MIKENVVKVPFRKLKYIHHISDIQIRNLKRHIEYEEVFERTYEQVKKHKDNAVVYIGGDIAHSKTEMSPELVDQLSRLFKNLSDICPSPRVFWSSSQPYLSASIAVDHMSMN